MCMVDAITAVVFDYDRCWAFPDGALFGNFGGAISPY